MNKNTPKDSYIYLGGLYINDSLYKNNGIQNALMQHTWHTCWTSTRTSTGCVTGGHKFPTSLRKSMNEIFFFLNSVIWTKQLLRKRTVHIQAKLLSNRSSISKVKGKFAHIHTQELHFPLGSLYCFLSTLTSTDTHKPFIWQVDTKRIRAVNRLHLNECAMCENVTLNETVWSY